MNGKKRNLIIDTEAVSPVIGAVLLMAIAVTMFTLFQATMVPYWNKQVEATELRVTYDDMMFLPSDIEDVAMHETPKTCTVQLGAWYPDRMIFRNPGPGAFGTLAVEEAPVPINVTYNNGTTYTVPYNSTRITYVMSGTINSPKLVYEHGVIITDWGAAGNVTTDEQKLIVNDNIYIPVVNGSSRSKSAIGVESIAIKPYEYLDTLGDINTVTVTLDTDYREVWWGLLGDYIDQGMVSISNQSKKIYINTSVPYLKLPNQTASGPLHAGMISCTVEDPDGGGGGGGGSGGDDEVGDYTSTGEGVMSSGSQWWNIPSSADITEMTLYNIVVDQAVLTKLDGDVIIFTVTDSNGNWWKLLIDFRYDKGNMEICGLEAKTASGNSTYQYDRADVSNSNPIVFDSSTSIDLLSESNYDTSDGCYQNAGIGATNCLVTYLGDDVNLKGAALVSYRLRVDD